MRRFVFGAALAVLAVPAFAQSEMHGASQFNDDHAFTKALVRFQELVDKYSGKKTNWVLHKNSELGLEKQYFEYMAQGKAVDYAIVSPAHMSTFSKAAPFIDAPFLFRDLNHWNKVLDADILKPVADEIAQKAEVMLIGYAGGGTRNIFVNKPVHNLAEMKGLKVRVQGAPIWSRTFAAIGMSPTVIAYNEIYNAIQNNVISAGENEAAETRDRIAAVLAASGRPHEIFEVQAPDIAATCRTVARRARESGGVLVAVGGDGTLNSAAQAALTEGCTLGVIAQGTFNLFAREHGLPVTGMPWPFSLNVCPICVVGGIFSRSDFPASVGTSASPPSTAVVNGIDTRV